MKRIKLFALATILMLLTVWMLALGQAHETASVTPVKDVKPSLNPPDPNTKAMFREGGDSSAVQDIAPIIDPMLVLCKADETFKALRTYSCKASSFHRSVNGNKESISRDVVNYYFQKPNYIRMEWLSPWQIKGQIAVYSDNHLKVKLNWMPLPIALDPNGKIAQDSAGNRIHQTDMGTLIKQIINIPAQSPVTVIKYEGLAKSNNRELLKISLINNEGTVCVYIDKKLYLPVIFECYSPDNKLIDAAYFENLRVDVPMDPYKFILDT